MRNSIILAILIALVAVGWVASGQIGQDPAAAITNAADSTPVVAREPFLVEAGNFSARPILTEIVLRGRTEAARRLELRTETAGKIRQIFVKQGARVRAGDVVLRIGMKDRKAQLAEATALVKQRQLEFDAASKLIKRGYRSKTKVAAAAALLEQAIARKQKIETDISHTTITAPFAGIVENRYVELGAVVDKNMALARIIDEDPFLVIGQISERDIGKIKVGDDARAKLLDGTEINGKIRFIAVIAEPKTRTFRVEIQVANKNKTLREGMTAEIHVAVSKKMAHFVTPAVLTLNDSGLLGVRTITDGQVVRFLAVEIIDDTKDGVWVGGLPNDVQIITVGHEFVSDGEKVRVKITQDQQS